LHRLSVRAGKRQGSSVFRSGSAALCKKTIKRRGIQPTATGGKARASLTVKSRGKTEIKGKYMKIKRALSFYKHCNSGLIAVKYYHKNTESNRKNCDL